MERVTDKKKIFKWKKSTIGEFMGTAAIVILFSLFLLFGMRGLWLKVVVPVSKVVESQSWIEIPAIVKKSEVIIHDDDDDSNTYSPEITYHYRYLGESYTSSQYNFNLYNSSQHKSTQIINRYPVDIETVCYVNPLAPSAAVLSRDYYSELLWGLLPLSFFLIGAILPVSWIYYYFTKDSYKLENDLDQVDEKYKDYFPKSIVKTDQRSDSRYLLKPDIPRLAKL